MRQLVSAVLGSCLLVSACSGQEVLGGDASAIAATPSTVAKPAAEATAQVSATERSLEATVRLNQQERTIAMPSGPDTSDDPFGRFVACSGWDSTVGVFNVVVADPDQRVAVSLVTDKRVTNDGAAAAWIHLELDGMRLDAHGVVELSGQLTQGVFTGASSDGGSAKLDFTCSGPTVPTALRSSDPATEVVTFLRHGDDQRIINLAVPVGCAADRVDVAPVTDGDEFRAITQFAASESDLSLTIGTNRLELADASVVAGEDNSGTFRATVAAGLSVPDATPVTLDGAFRCSSPEG